MIKKVRIQIMFLLFFVFCGVISADIDLTSYLENPSFEEPAMFPEEQECDALGWLNYYGYNGVQCPVTYFAANQFIASDGSNCLRQVGTTISQVPALLAIQPNTVYTLEADILVSSEQPDPNEAWALIELKAAQSDVTLGFWGGLYPYVIADDIAGLQTDTWYRVNCQFDSSDPANSPYVGETLAVSAQGDRHYVDNFTLSSTGTSVNLTVSATAGAEEAITVPGTGTFPVGDGWTVPLEALKNYVACPDLFTFTSWTGANSSDPVTDVTINGNTAVSASYSKTSPGCSMVWSGEMVEIFNADFEESAEGYVIPFWSKGAAPTGTWVQRPPDPSTSEDLDFTSSGNQMIFVGSGGQLHQIPGEVIEADTLYTVEIDMASRSDADPDIAWAILGLFAKNDTTQTLDGTLLVQQGFGWVASELLNPLPDQWYTKTFTWDSTGSPHVGKYLQIYLNGDRVTMDNLQIRKFTQGIAADVTIDSNPSVFSTAGGRPSVSPSPGSYQVAIGGSIDITVGGFQTCPNTYVPGAIETSYGNFTGAAATVVVDDDGAVNVLYDTSNQCGDECHPEPVMDFSGDCIVNLEDFAEFVYYWLDDNRP